MSSAKILTQSREFWSNPFNQKFLIKLTKLNYTSGLRLTHGLPSSLPRTPFNVGLIFWTFNFHIDFHHRTISHWALLCFVSVTISFTGLLSPFLCSVPMVIFCYHLCSLPLLSSFLWFRLNTSLHSKFKTSFCIDPICKFIAEDCILKSDIGSTKIFLYSSEESIRVFLWCLFSFSRQIFKSVCWLTILFPFCGLIWTDITYVELIVPFLRPVHLLVQYWDYKVLKLQKGIYFQIDVT